MSVRRWIGLGVVIALVAGLASVARAEGGRPSRAALEAMGLSSLVVISDEDATSVRGQGYMGGSYVRVTGSSFATIEGPDGGSHSENSYFAEGKHDAKGSNSSFAGVADIWIGGHKPGGGDGGYGGGKPRSGNGYGGMPGGGHPGGGGGGYGNVKIHTRVYFSGGSSSAWAF
jgi:hypothetical protein